ncbi:hypothetical protein HDU93_004250 [Gonapodya sp. JEL0774]|nr:hypothetical protein HDU93_004250 [Gonapodya sp. JEL0774]
MTERLNLSWDEACSVLEERVTLDVGVVEFLTWCLVDQCGVFDVAVLSGAFQPCVSHLLHHHLPAHIADRIRVIACPLSVTENLDAKVPDSPETSLSDGEFDHHPMAESHGVPSQHIRGLAPASHPRGALHHDTPPPSPTPAPPLPNPNHPLLHRPTHSRVYPPPPNPPQPHFHRPHYRTWRLHHPDDSECGFDKSRVVKAAREWWREKNTGNCQRVQAETADKLDAPTSPLVVFVGDGFNDVSVAWESDFVAARKDKHLHRVLALGVGGEDVSRDVQHGVATATGSAGLSAEVTKRPGVSEWTGMGQKSGEKDHDGDLSRKDMRWTVYEDFRQVKKAVQEWARWKKVVRNEDSAEAEVDGPRRT